MTKLLVVDDEADILDSLELAFEEDYDVLTASGGPEALEILAGAYENEDLAGMLDRVSEDYLTSVRPQMKQELEDRFDAIRSLPVQVPPPGAVAGEVEDPVGRPLRLEDRLRRPPGHALRGSQRLEVVDLAESFEYDVLKENDLLFIDLEGKDGHIEAIDLADDPNEVCPDPWVERLIEG